MPLVAFAAVQQDPSALLSGSGGGLVPQCEGALCRACDLIELSSNVINFAIAFSVIIATLMFAYAGILYVTAASKPDQVKKAHGVFINVFVGLCIVLTAWLLVNITFSVLTGRGLAIWTDISCVGNPTSAAFPDAPGAPTPRPRVTGTGTPVAPTNRNDNLAGVHPDLVRLVNAAHACSAIQFQVTSGFRQRSSTATDSRHIQGMAVDAHPIIRSIVSYTGGSCAPPNANYRAINDAFACGSRQTGIPYQWGGSSPTFMQNRCYDSMHFQLPRSVYPNG